MKARSKASKGKRPGNRRVAVSSRRRPRAKTEEIIAPARKEPPVPSKWKAHFKKLSALRNHLLHTRGDLKEDADNETPTYSLHMADAATDNYDRDFALSMLSSEQNAIYEIEQALQRIRDGTYGKCEMTGKPIPSERLEAVPWTRFSTDAERDLERRGAVAQAKLGAVARVVKESGEESDND